MMISALLRQRPHLWTGLMAGALLAWLPRPAAAWQLKTAPLLTDWAQLVDTNAPLPEYPRPQMVRAQWLNLNGLWQFQAGAANDSVPTHQTLAGDILVPYPMESALSGVMQHYDRAWYRRTFTVPPDWQGQHLLLHLDAVDWEAEVFVNGQSVGLHHGGYDAFTYDITPYLNGTGPQELIVRVYDPTDGAGEPRGKQTLYPGGIMYTPTSGIWQSVWLEPVPATRIASFHAVPDIDNQRLTVTVNVAGPTNGISVQAVARIGTNLVSTVSGAPGASLILPVPNPNLWSPTNPFLYDLDLTLANGPTQVDAVTSYFGMRKISLGTVNGFVKMLLNNSFVFQFGPLDQGFWPDGIYRAPTDDALKSDIEQEKTLGFNMIRKHIKVEPARWYYWADKLGMLVWQDMPSANSYTGNPQPLDVPEFESELLRMVTNHWNHPAIIMWVIFNESQGQHDTESLVSEIKSLDPSRLVNQASGGSYYGVGDILDWHSYPNPACPTSSNQAVVCGEFGGVGLGITNHTWASGWGYVGATDGNDLAAKFEDFCFQLSDFVQNHGLSAAVYTQTTDVETELNGLLTYDRKVRKPDADRIRAAVFSASAAVTQTTVLPTSQTAGQTWKYTTGTPGANWYASNYNDAAWSSGQAGFGANNPPNTTGLIRTTWNTADIWLRRNFNPGSLTAQQISNLFFTVYHDEDVEIYVNGVLAGSASGYTTSYTLLPVNAAGRAALVPNANNVLAVHCHQTGGGQYIDVGLTVRQSTVNNPARPAPPKPTGLRAALGSLGVSLGWNSAMDAIRYRLKRATVSGGPYTDVVATPPVNSATDTTTVGGTTYYYVVSAMNASGESADSDEVSITAPYAVPPSPVAWLKADALTGLANGAPVSTWPDVSGRGFDALQTTSSQKPTYLAAALNGLPAVHFNGTSSNYLALSRPVEDDFTILCVYRSSQGIGTGTQFYQGAGLVNGEVSGVAGDFGLSLNTNGYVLAGTGAPDTTIASSSSGFNNGLPHLVTFRRQRSGGVLELYVDGTVQGTATGGTQSLTAPTQLVLGAQQTLVNFLTGDLAEVKIFAAALTPADRTAEENALLCKYGIGSGAPPAAPQDLRGTPGNRQVSLDWLPAAGASGYKLNWSASPAGPYTQVIGNLTTTSFTDTNAVVGATNYYKVAAYSPCGTGSNSAVVAVLLPLPALTVGTAGGSLTFTWPDWANDWGLYSATNLAPPVIWSLVTNPPVTSNGFLSVTLLPSAAAQFFRLVGP
ncbi:MAG TPA: LamG-like jellyroll fold domain-containing protein [Verrucomicrobiae bacterium]|nr:LamG-like jellyroll fold domain-containing protein [Verrucomicrobiae bacterium]